MGTGKVVKRFNPKAVKEFGANLKKTTIRKLARRGGVKRISNSVYKGVREAAEKIMKTLVRDASVYADGCKRKTVTAMDVVFALKKNGKTLYGFGG